MNYILLAEDNIGDVMLVREALAAHHVENMLRVVADGQEALDLVATIGESTPCPDLMLLDLNLPKADGAAVLAAFRVNRACTNTPVIIVSSSNNIKDRSRVSELGVDHYFHKPLDFDEFMKLGKVVKEVLDAGGGGARNGVGVK